MGRSTAANIIKRESVTAGGLPGAWTAEDRRSSLGPSKQHVQLSLSEPEHRAGHTSGLTEQGISHVLVQSVKDIWTNDSAHSSLRLIMSPRSYFFNMSTEMTPLQKSFCISKCS